MFKIPIYAIAWLLVPPAAWSQTVSGLVLEDSTRVPIAGAIVELTTADGGQVARARTDSTGAFLVRPRRGGSYKVLLSHPSYLQVTTTSLKIQPGETIELMLRMGRSAIPLEPLVVSARSTSRLSGFYERQKQEGGFGRFLTRQDIETRKGAVKATDLLRDVAGVEIVSTSYQGGTDDPNEPPPPPGTPDKTMPRAQMLTMRSGGANCLPAIFVDGMRVMQTTDFSIDDIIKPDMLEGVEVYIRSAGVPSELVAINGCGVVAFWTRADSGEGKFSWIKLGGAFGGFLLLFVLTGGSFQSPGS